MRLACVIFDDIELCIRADYTFTYDDVAHLKLLILNEMRDKDV